MPSHRAFLRFSPALLLLWSNIASAGPVERMSDVALHPTNPDVMVVHYLNGGTGLLYSTDGGHNFSLLCAAGIDMSRPNGPVAIASDGRVIVGTFDTLWQDDGKGCSWATVPELKGLWTTDLQIDATDPTRLIAISGNGGDGVKNGIMRRDSAGQWAPLGTQDPIGLTRVRTVKTASGMRIYESALRVDSTMAQPSYLVRVSDDEGKTWTENPLPMQAKSGSMRLEAVDPSNPDRILVVVDREKDNDDLLLSRDAGKTFEPYLTVSDLGGLTMAPDGRIWIGEPVSISDPMASKGLWFAANLDAKPTKVAEYGVECLAYQAKTESLFACQALSFGKIDTKSGEFSSFFQFMTAKEMVSCNGTSVAMQCETQLCADYCGAGHFAKAPVCCAYNTSSCGPQVAVQEGNGGPQNCPGGAAPSGAGTAGMSSSASGAPAAAGGGATGTSSAAGARAAAAGSATTGSNAGSAAPPMKSPGGCGCVALGQDGRQRSWLSLSLLFSLAILRRRRARHSAAQQA